MSSNIEKFMEGQYSLTPAEEAAIREEALKEGKDPEKAVEAKKEEMKNATGRLRDKQAEGAISGLEDEMEKKSGRKTPERLM